MSIAQIRFYLPLIVALRNHRGGSRNWPTVKTSSRQLGGTLYRLPGIGEGAICKELAGVGDVGAASQVAHVPTNSREEWKHSWKRITDFDDISVVLSNPGVLPALAGFVEPPVHFPPTFPRRLGQAGSFEYCNGDTGEGIGRRFVGLNFEEVRRKFDIQKDKVYSVENPGNNSEV